MPARSIDVFLTYDPRDADLARDVRAAVIAGGMSCWCEAVDLVPGQLWDEEIPARLRTARIVAVLITRHWPISGEANADWYGPEKVALAIDQASESDGEPIIVPVRLRGGTKDRVPYGIRRAAAVELGEDDPKRLADELRRVLAHRDGQPAPETAATARAVEIGAAQARQQAHADPGERADVVIITALKVELDALIEVSGVPWSEARDRHGFPYRATELAGLRIVAARTGGMGERDATERAVRLHDAFDPQVLAICGFCAGHPVDTVPGDVVIATRVFNFEQGKHRPDGTFEPDQAAFELRRQWKIDAEDLAHEPARWLGTLADQRPASLRWLREQAIVRLHRDAIVEEHPELPPEVRDRVWHGLVTRGFVVGEAPDFELTEAGHKEARRVLWHRGPHVDRPIRAHLGVMATGAAVRQDTSVWQQVTALQRKTIAVEMESAAIGAIAGTSLKDFLAIKGVADHADADKDERFHRFAAQAAAAFLLAFVRAHVTPRRQVISPASDHGNTPAPPATARDASPVSSAAIRDATPLTREWLDAAALAQLIDAYVDHPLDRDLLLSWVPRALVSSLPHKSTPYEQITSDLGQLNRAPRSADGEPPLAAWLRQAVRLAGPWPHARVYAGVLATLEAKVKASTGKA